MRRNGAKSFGPWYFDFSFCIEIGIRFVKLKSSFHEYNFFDLKAHKVQSFTEGYKNEILVLSMGNICQKAIIN